MITTRTEGAVQPKAALVTKIQEGPIDVGLELARATCTADGAVSIFVGQVRDHDPQADGQAVTGIEYSAHPDAEVTLRREVAGVVGQVPARVVVIHRVGDIVVGEAVLLVLVSTSHRDPAMTLVPALVERIKETLPVWKRQRLQDGTSRWSNLP